MNQYFALGFCKQAGIEKEALLGALARFGGKALWGAAKAVGSTVMKHPGLTLGAALTAPDLIGGARAGARAAQGQFGKVIHNVAAGNI